LDENKNNGRWTEGKRKGDWVLFDLLPLPQGSGVPLF
jgi:hypothetical protein